jgi:Ribosomal protein L22p/L17e
MMMLRQLASMVSSNGVRARHGWSSMMMMTPTTTTTSRCWNMLQKPFSTMSPLRQYQQQPQQRDEVDPKFLTIQTSNGRTFHVLDSRKLPTLKPHIIKRRLARMRTYVDAQKGIRHSPWRLNLICQMIAGLSVPEAIRQLTFCDKSRAPLVQDLVENAVKKATEKHGIPQTKLEIAECFVTRGTPLKRIRYMGRGRYAMLTTYGKKSWRFCWFVGSFASPSPASLDFWHWYCTDVDK